MGDDCGGGLRGAAGGFVRAGVVRLLAGAGETRGYDPRGLYRTSRRGATEAAGEGGYGAACARRGRTRGAGGPGRGQGRGDADPEPEGALQDEPGRGGRTRQRRNPRAPEGEEKASGKGPGLNPDGLDQLDKGLQGRGLVGDLPRPAYPAGRAARW